jgi:hypothetical protein
MSDTAVKSASRNPLVLWRDQASGRVMGDGQCEWCGQRIYCRRATWYRDEKGYILTCGASDC